MKEVFKHLVTVVLTFEARLLLARKKPKIIAVTGNVGKTSTKDAIYTVIRGHVRARKSEKSYNSDIGVPLTILGLPNAWSNPFGWIRNLIEGLFIALFTRQYPDWLVLEMGVDRPGDMKRLVNLAHPDIAVLTSFPDVPVHVEYFGSKEAVIEEKMTLPRALGENGVVIFNADDENIRTALKDFSHQLIGFGAVQPAPYMTTAAKVLYDQDLPSGYEFTLSHGSESGVVSITGSLGLHFEYAAAAAAAVGGALGISLSDAIAALEKHAMPPGRMRLIRGVEGSMLLDDTYNASPLAVQQALETLSSVTGAKRKIAILGDMLELGRLSVAEHQKIGQLVATNVDALMTVGIRARGIASSAREAGMKESRVIEYTDAEAAGADLPHLLKPGDVVLIKGSQGMRMERIVYAVMAEPERAGELLVRQDILWGKK